MSSCNNIFEGKTVLVTGDTGFKGPWLCLWLLQLGAEVVGYALPPADTNSLFRKLALGAHMTHVDGDIRDMEHLGNTIRQYNPDFVFHMAAQSLVRRSFKEPLDTFSTNIQGTVNILDAVRHHGRTRVVINVTTDKVYLNREWEYAYRENDPLGGLDPYSASKACADIVAAVYQQVDFMGNGVGVATVRSGNVYGGGDWAQDRLVPDIVRAYQTNVPIQLRNPGSVRPWQYVLEPLAGYLLLASRLYNSPESYAGAWNFGPTAQNMLTVREFVSRFLTHWPSTMVSVQEEPDGPKETNVLRLDCTKSSSMLGWTPALSLDEGLEQTAAWYLADLEGRISLSKALEVISDYTTVAKLRTPLQG